TEVNPADDFFAPRNREYFFVRKLAQGGRKGRAAALGWTPTRPGASNTRLDFLKRLHVQGLGKPISHKDAHEILDVIWARSLELDKSTSAWRDYFSQFHLEGHGVGYRIKPDVWELRPGILEPEIQWYICDRCKSLTLLNLRGVCPTYQCSGTLHACDPA